MNTCIQELSLLRFSRRHSSLPPWIAQGDQGTTNRISCTFMPCPLLSYLLWKSPISLLLPILSGFYLHMSVFAMLIIIVIILMSPVLKTHSIHSFIARCRNPKVHHDESKFVVASPTSLCRWTDHLHRCQVLKSVYTMPRAHAGLEVLKSAGRSTEFTPVCFFFFLTPCTQRLPSQCIQDSVNAYLQPTCTRLHYFHRRLVILLTYYIC